MSKEEAIELAKQIMRARNYCEIAYNRMLAQIKEKDSWDEQELKALLLGKKHLT